MAPLVVNDLPEEADAYPAVVWRGVDLRVIVSRNDRQWIVQRAGGSRHGSRRWRGFWHSATRKGLERFLPRSSAANAPSLAAWIAQQPTHLPRKTDHV